MNSSYTASVCRMESTSCGTHRVKISTDSQICGMYSAQSIQCGKFTVGEYQWAILYSPYHNLVRGLNDEYSVSFHLELLSQSQISIRAFLCFSLVDETGNLSNTKRGTFTYHKKGDKWGFDYFMKRSDLVSAKKNDSFMIQCSVNTFQLSVEDVPNKYSIPVPPSDLQQHLNHLLQSGENADVSFKIKGETFPAHRIILAARSSVFCAELFGSMRESKADSVEIEDMEPEVFKALLRFIYTDMLLSSDEIADEDIIAQHLIVAADRYHMERLRLICEEMLANKIGSNNAMTTLALAARHNFIKLKEVCLDYISSSEVLDSLTETDVFKGLCTSYPLIIKELLEKVAAKKKLKEFTK